MKTVKVRIAVAVDKEGHWSAVGFCQECGGNDAALATKATDGLPSHEAATVNFIEAEIPIPEPTIVQGTVT